jgi:hypothetical protein
MCFAVEQLLRREIFQMFDIVSRNGAVVFAVRVRPRAGRDAVTGLWQGALKVKLKAPPVDDRANEALCKFLAESLNIAVAAVRILAGERSRSKRVEIRGVTAGQVRQAFLAAK